MRLLTVCLAAITVFVAAVSGAVAQGKHPVRFLVPYSAGGAVDIYARAVAVPMAKALGQVVLVDNMGGAGGNIAVARVARSAPDGETLLFHNMAMAINPSLYRKLEYDPLSDFEYVGVVAHSVMALVARTTLPVADLKQLVQYARMNGEKVTIGDGGVGGPTNLCALLLMSAIGSKFTIVHYKGGAPALNDLMGGSIDLLCDGTAAEQSPIASGKVKALGVSSKARLHSMPNIPTLDEGGLPGFELTPWSGIYAPKGTPKATIQRLESALQTALADKDLISYFDKQGLIAASRDEASSEGLRNQLKAEIEKWGALLKKNGVLLD